jgi:hypothetical protein
MKTQKYLLTMIAFELAILSGTAFGQIGGDSVFPIETGPLKGQKGRRFWGLQIEPSHLDLGTLSPDGNTNVTVSIQLLEGSPLLITKTACTVPGLEAVVQPVVEGTNYLIQIFTKPPLRYGAFHGRLLVKTDKSWRPELSIGISATVTGLLDVAEWEISVPVGKGIPAVPRYIRIRSRNNKPFKIVEVIPPNPNVRIGKITQIEDGVYMISLSVQPTLELEGQSVRIVTDVESMKEVFVPFRVWSAGGESKRSAN